MTWKNDCAQLILLVDRSLLEHRAAALSGKPVSAVEFAPTVDLNAVGGRELQARITDLADLAERVGPQRSLPPVVAADLRERLLDCLLGGLLHNSTHAIRMFSGRAETLPRSLRRARDFLQAHAAEPLDVAQLAEAAGTGIRALQIGFRRHFETSISEMLLDIRLAQLNSRLSNARPDQRITGVALELGFTHLSRMARAYRAKFGETPSATLRRLSRKTGIISVMPRRVIRSLMQLAAERRVRDPR